MDSRPQTRQNVYERGSASASIGPNVPTDLSGLVGPTDEEYDPLLQAVFAGEDGEVGEAEIGSMSGLNKLNAANASNVLHGPNSLNDERRLPPELWLHVLLFLTTRELRVTASLSSFFYRLSIPILYECVEWKIGWRGLASSSYSTRMLMGSSISAAGRNLSPSMGGGGDGVSNSTGVSGSGPPVASGGTKGTITGSGSGTGGSPKSSFGGITGANRGIGDTADTLDNLEPFSTHTAHEPEAANYSRDRNQRGNGLLDRVKSCRISRELDGRHTLKGLKKGKAPKHGHEPNYEEVTSWPQTRRPENIHEDLSAGTNHPLNNQSTVIIPPYSHVSVILRMDNLRRLSFNEILIPYEFICRIPTLINLRELEIRSCDIESSYTYEQMSEDLYAADSNLRTRSPSPNTGQWDEDDSPMESSENQGSENPHANPWTTSGNVADTDNTRNPAKITHLTLLGIQMSLEPLLLPTQTSSSQFRRYSGGIEYFYRTVVTSSLKYLHTTSFELTNIKKIFEDLVTSDNSSNNPDDENAGTSQQNPSFNGHGAEDEASAMFHILEHFCINCCVRASGPDGLLPFLWRFGQGITRLEISNKDDSDNSNQFREWLEGHLSPLVQHLNTASGSSSSSISASRRFLPNLTSYAGPSILLDVLYRGRELKDISLRDRLPKVGRSDWRAEDGDAGAPAVENLLDALEGWGFTNNNANAQQMAAALVFGNNQPQPNPNLNLNVNVNVNQNQANNLQDLLAHWVANRTPQRSQLGRDAIEIDMKKLEDNKIVKEMAEYLARSVQMALRQLDSRGVVLERLELALVIWDIDLLLMVVNLMPNLKELEIRCYKQGPDEQFYMSFWGNFLHMLPNLQRLHIYDLSLPSVPSRSAGSASLEQFATNSRDSHMISHSHRGEKQEAMSMQDQRQAVRMISRFRPDFSEMSMTRAIVWKRLPYPTADEIATGRGWGYELRPGYENTPDDPYTFVNGQNRSENMNRNDSNGSGSGPGSGNHERTNDGNDNGNGDHGSSYPSTSNPNPTTNSSNRSNQHRGGGKFHPSGGNGLSMLANANNHYDRSGSGSGSARTGVYSGWRDAMADDMEDDDDDYEMAGLYDHLHHPGSESENGDIDSDDSIDQSGHGTWGIGPLRRRVGTSHIGQRIQPPHESQQTHSPFQQSLHTQTLQPHSPQDERRNSFTSDPHHNEHHSLDDSFLYSANTTVNNQMNPITASDMMFYASLQPAFNQISLDHSLHDGLSDTTGNNSAEYIGQVQGETQAQSQGRIRDIHTRSRSRSIHPLQLYPDENNMDSFHSPFPSQSTQSFYSPYSPPYDSTSLSASISTTASHSAFQTISNNNPSTSSLMSASAPVSASASVSASVPASASARVSQHHRQASDSFFGGFGYKYGASPYEHENVLYNQAYNQSLDMDLGGFFDTASLGGNLGAGAGVNVGLGAGIGVGAGVRGYEGYETDYSYYDTSLLYSGTNSSSAAGAARSRAHSTSDSGGWSELGGLENLQITMMDTMPGNDGIAQNQSQGQNHNHSQNHGHVHTSMGMGMQPSMGINMGVGVGMHSIQSGQQIQPQAQQMQMDHEEEDVEFVNVLAQLYPRYVHMWD